LSTTQNSTLGNAHFIAVYAGLNLSMRNLLKLSRLCTIFRNEYECITHIEYCFIYRAVRRISGRNFRRLWVCV